jgi:hypothetical protein
MERLTRHQTVLYQRHQRQRIHDLFMTKKNLHGIRDAGTHPTPWVPSAQRHEIPPVRTCWAIAPLTILSGFETTCSAQIVLKHIKHIKPSVKPCSPCSFVPCRFCPLDLLERPMVEGSGTSCFFLRGASNLGCMCQIQS